MTTTRPGHRSATRAGGRPGTTTRPKRVARAVGWAAVAAGALQVAPAVAALGPLRRRLMPDPRSTPAFLAALDVAGVRATFFVLGRMLARAPGLGREMVAAGHEIALHGWGHRCLLVRGPRGTHVDVTRGYDLIADVTGHPPRWYRPPYGVLTAAALATAARLGLTPVLWSSWGVDWTARATPASVLATVRRDLTGGGTVLLHDSDCTSAPGSWRATLGALPALIDGVRDAGLAIGPLRGHGVRGGHPPHRPGWPS